MFAGTPLAIYTALGRGTDEPHLTALLVGLIYLVYALGEETGWRGFLQGALTPLTTRVRYALIYPGHRPPASALGYVLPARWAGFVFRLSQRTDANPKPAQP